MKILQIGPVFVDNDVVLLQFLSQKYILDYDTVYVDLSSLALEFTNFLTLQTGFTTPQKEENFLVHINNRDKQINEFYQHGGNIILISNRNPIFEYVVRTPHGVHNTKSIDLIKLFCFNSPQINYVSQLGDIVDNDSCLAELKQKCIFNFYAIIQNFEGIKLLWTHKAQKVVSFYSIYEKGIFICLPGYKYKDNTPQILVNTKKEVLSDLIELINFLKNGGGIASIVEPEWIKDYILANEDKYINEFFKLNEQLEVLKKQLEKQETGLKKYSDIKSLLYLDGNSLELKIKQYLDLLGFRTEKPSGYDADITIAHEKFFGVLEVKGVKGSAAKSHSRQLENWVTNYELQNDTAIKGILIINTYKNIPISNRNDISFPPDMVDYSTLRNHCLLLTIDLLNIIIDFENKLITTNEIAELFNNCNGVLSYQIRLQ